MQSNIPQKEVDDFLNRVKNLMRAQGLPQWTIEGTYMSIIHPEDWEVSIFVPHKAVKINSLRRTMERILFRKCGVEQRCCDYLGRQNDFTSLEWYFRHPNVPQEIYERIDAEMEQEDESEPLQLPSPNNFSISDTAYLSLKDEFFEMIERGEKTTEYRTINQYYCDKFFSSGTPKRYVRFNRGYLPGIENQMKFEICGFVLVGETGDEIPVVDAKGNLIVTEEQLPTGFWPVSYGIKLGKRIS